MNIYQSDFLDLFVEFLIEKSKKIAISKFINQDILDYTIINPFINNLDQDDLSIILKYDKNYSISFLLSIANKAYEDDLTKQALFLLKRYNLNYILPLLEYVDEDEIRNEYNKKSI